jgi:peptidoglycan/LPS O-acetylase OafA/YrhL
MHVAQLPGTLDEFGAGIFLAKTLHGSAGRGSRAAWISVPAAIVLGSVCMGVYWPRAGYWDLPVMVVFWHTLVAAFLLCVVAAAMHLPSFAERGPARPAYYLGDVSYGIYLWHPLAIQLCLKIPDITPPQVLVATLGLTLMAAMMSWHFLEKPLLGWGRKLPHREAPRVQSLPQRGP